MTPRWPNFRPQNRSRRHSAGIPGLEAVVRYPFHPQCGHVVQVIGELEHDGKRHLLIRGTPGGSYQIPEWMFGDEAAAAKIITVVRFPIAQLTKLRALVDRLIVTSLAEEEAPKGVIDEKASSSTNGLVQHSNPTGQPSRYRPRKGDCSSSNASNGSSDDLRAQQEHGGWQKWPR